MLMKLTPDVKRSKKTTRTLTLLHFLVADMTSVENRHPHNFSCPMKKVIFGCCLLRLIHQRLALKVRLHDAQLQVQEVSILETNL